jgi:hypothetical protein
VYLRVLCGEFLHEDITTEDSELHRGEFFRGSLIFKSESLLQVRMHSGPTSLRHGIWGLEIMSIKFNCWLFFSWMLIAMASQASAEIPAVASAPGANSKTSGLSHVETNKTYEQAFDFVRVEPQPIRLEISQPACPPIDADSLPLRSCPDGKDPPKETAPSGQVEWTAPRDAGPDCQRVKVKCESGNPTCDSSNDTLTFPFLICRGLGLDSGRYCADCLERLASDRSLPDSTTVPDVGLALVDRCVLRHEYTHLNDFLRDRSISSCQTEQNAGRAELDCLKLLKKQYCRALEDEPWSPECREILSRICNANRIIAVNQCVCEKNGNGQQVSIPGCLDCEDACDSARCPVSEGAATCERLTMVYCGQQLGQNIRSDPSVGEVDEACLSTLESTYRSCLNFGEDRLEMCSAECRRVVQSAPECRYDNLSDNARQLLDRMCGAF